MTILNTDGKHFAISDRPAQLEQEPPRFADLEVGDEVNGRWTITKVTRTDKLVAAVGTSPAGERFALTGEPHKKLRHTITREDKR